MLIHWKLSWKWKKEQHIKCLRLILHFISIDCKPYSYSENFYNIFSVNEKVTFYSMCKISKFSNKSMSQLSFSRHNFGKQSVLPFPKKLKKLAHPRLFYHPMAAEGSTVIPHQVTESSTEKRQNTDFFLLQKQSTNKTIASLEFAIKSLIPIIYTYLSFYNCILLGLGS